MSVIVDHISKIYGEQKAVDSISFQVNKGEIVGFLGPNGAGKSTTMKILTCFIPQSSGQASVCGHDVINDSMEVRRKVGYLPEQNPLYLDMYVREYLMFMASLRQLGAKSKARVDNMIERTGLTLECKKKIGQLSKGYKQRVGLAQAMLHEPEVLILDEPTSGLDPNQLVEIRSLIRQIGKDKTVILSTHIMQEVEALCSRAIIINKGKIVADDSIAMLQGKLGKSSRLTVEFRDPVHSDLLRKIEGVSQVESLGDKKFALLGSPVDRIKEQVFALAVKNQTILLSMQEEEQKLESVFRELTQNAPVTPKKVKSK
ncbi:MAG TPA: gliding motility-associated ABC transporter ATP-binding subunit GldA [Bacteroidetes bacterium]|nr:gliding motility-associated ABC transporter ATP-binding subunit GldA [Bacteroidota bacterium]